ncbi:hypothetical protein MCOR29_000710 [Pyricularia oryzae]|nr:hypothetical protein MCOR29_000710 [Pyricularia oryzae]KAI6458722.1 hypothetical protein MCOR17_007269 [Pyricularia oryzae]KAI6508432.1 hypothetical protein MCOR13_002182 [Pyricularia oryzae]KAI6527379.1 hypothetical protein MCOR16_005757 [Pyricularia oryzae]
MAVSRPTMFLTPAISLPTAPMPGVPRLVPGLVLSRRAVRQESSHALQEQHKTHMKRVLPTDIVIVTNKARARCNLPVWYARFSWPRTHPGTTPPGGSVMEG